MPSCVHGVEKRVQFQVLGLGGKRCPSIVSYAHAIQASNLSLWKASITQAVMPGDSWGKYNGCEDESYPLLPGFRVDFLVLEGEGEGAAFARVRACSSSFMRCLYFDDCLMRLISCKKKRPHACLGGMSELQ